MNNLSQISTPVLPHQSNVPFLLDGGCETSLIFLDKVDLPHFASFTLLETVEGTALLRRYFERYLSIARAQNLGFILETPTWRASSDWGALLGYDKKRLAEVNVHAIELMQEIRAGAQPAEIPIIVSGCIGPRGDGYAVGSEMTAEEAETYHRAQLETFKSAGAEMVTALTMTYVAEAIGITRAAKAVGLPVVVSFTTEIDGKLPTGQALGEAIVETDRETGNAPIYYMVNCAHPDHFRDALNGDWLTRVGGVRANASRLSHAELDEAEELDDGDPIEFGELHRALVDHLPNVHALGGCCGTDHRHVDAVAKAFTN